MQFHNTKQFSLGSTCSDSDVDPWKKYCSSWKSYCSYHSGVRANCKKTCNLCGGGGGGGEIDFNILA